MFPLNARPNSRNTYLFLEDHDQFHIFHNNRDKYNIASLELMDKGDM